MPGEGSVAVVSQAPRLKPVKTEMVIRTFRGKVETTDMKASEKGIWEVRTHFLGP